MHYRVQKTAVYTFFPVCPVCKENLDDIERLVTVLEGETPDVEYNEEKITAIVHLDGSGEVNDFGEILKSKLVDFENLSDLTPCDVEKVYEEPFLEVYVCWTHKRKFVVDTTYLSDTSEPKTCEEVEERIRKAKESEEEFWKDAGSDDIDDLDLGDL